MFAAVRNAMTPPSHQVHAKLFVHQAVVQILICDYLDFACIDEVTAVQLGFYAATMLIRELI